MTNTDPMHQLERPLLTDDQLRLTLEDALEEAILPQLWFIFLDAEGRLTGPLMPGDGYPEDPSELVDTDDLGRVSAAQLLSARVQMIADMLGAASAALVWERPGPDELSPSTSAWVKAMAGASRDSGLRLRAQLLLHDEGLRMLVPDDFARIESASAPVEQPAC